MTKAKLAQLAQADDDAKAIATLTGTVSLDIVADYLRRFRGVKRVKSTRLKLAIVAAGGKVQGFSAVFPDSIRLTVAEAAQVAELIANPPPPTEALKTAMAAKPLKRKPESDLVDQARAMIAANRDVTYGEVAKKLGVKVGDVLNALHGGK